jgi:hypothetical protein
MDTMVCNTTMKPILLAAGILAVVASTAMFFFGRDAEPTTPKAAA